MNIKRTEENEKEAFQAFVEEKSIGKMAYKMFGTHQLIIEHTEVDSEFKGEGIGMKLLKAVVTYAREHDFKIIPICPYAKKMFEKHSELRDVL